MRLTDDEIASFDAYQAAGFMHPFTCGNKDRRGEFPHPNGGDDVLVAMFDGLYCPSCNYCQGWAHPWMLDWSWKSMSPFAAFADVAAAKKVSEDEGHL